MTYIELYNNAQDFPVIVWQGEDDDAVTQWMVEVRRHFEGTLIMASEDSVRTNEPVLARAVLG